MSRRELPTTCRCTKLYDLPPVVNDWQQKAWHPDCEYYDDGLCGNLGRRASDMACPLDGDVLPLREVPMEMTDNQQGISPDFGSREPCENPPWSEVLEQAVKLRIVERTGKRIRALTIELTDRDLIIRGTAPCYHVKQLALCGILDVLRSAPQTKHRFDVQILVCPPKERESTPPAE